MIHSEIPSANSSQKINLLIYTQHVRDIIRFCVKNQIPFGVDYGLSNTSTSTPATLPIVANTEIAATQIEQSALPEFVDDNLDNIIRTVYHTYIVKNIHQLPPTEKEIAATAGVSHQAFQRLFRSKYGKPFYQVYMEKRMEHAAKLLKKGYTCNEVSQMIGYGESSAIKFNKMFQKYFGKTPKKYQMEYHGSLNKRNRV
jgi:AraC-like DNA-binding protein